MAQKFIIAIDRAHLRIYRYSQQPGQFTPSIQPVDAFDLPPHRSSFAEVESDLSGRYPNARGRLPSSAAAEQMAAADDRAQQIVDQLSDRITAFLEKNPNSTWDLAAGAALRILVLEALPEAVRRRLDQVIDKELVNVPPIELREHFALR